MASTYVSEIHAYWHTQVTITTIETHNVSTTNNEERVRCARATIIACEWYLGEGDLVLGGLLGPEPVASQHCAHGDTNQQRRWLK